MSVLEKAAVSILAMLLSLVLVFSACAAETVGAPPTSVPVTAGTPVAAATVTTGIPPAPSPTSGTTGSPTPAATPEALPSPTPQRPPREGYGLHVKGVNYDDDSLDKAIALNFEWIKIYDHPPAERLPFKVLYRVELPLPGEDWTQWAEYRRIDAELYRGRIDAYEIGNEPNLAEEWGGNPDPVAYAELLELAYATIKAVDPTALIVSAGLAPVGEGSDPRYVSDLLFLREMYKAGAADHFDVLTIHPFGFAYPPEIPPDGKACPQRTPLDGLALDRGCYPIEGLCFRRAELLREIMLEYGDGDKPVWATEFGWIVRPPACCLAQSDWPAHYWQAVSEGVQARYTIRAFAYAEREWPWMEVMFLWNLDFSRYTDATDQRCPNCDSMGWYSILDTDGSPRLAYEWLLEEETQRPSSTQPD